MQAGDTDGVAGNAAPRLLEVVRTRIRCRHFRYRTEQAHVGWVRRYIGIHDRRHPREMGARDGLPVLMPALPYGAGLRLVGCVRLRVRDLDRGGRGGQNPLDR